MQQKLLFLLVMFSFQYLSAQNITRIEYFLDTDKGVGLNTIITPAALQDGLFPFVADPGNASPGPHVLFVRTQDENGNWSQTIRKKIEVQPRNAEATNIQLEYFYDVDPGFGAGRKLPIEPAAGNSSVELKAITADVSPGIHSLYIRSFDSYGRWSQTTRRVIEILPFEQARQIVAGEYFFDLDPGTGSGKALEISAKDSVINQSFKPDLAGINAGPHAIFIRYLDNNGKWGHTTRRTIDVNPAPDSNLVVTLEYAVNKDKGPGSGIPVQIPVPATDITFQYRIPVQNLTPGFDTIYVRVKDKSSIHWSITRHAIGYVILPLTLLDLTGTRQQDQVNLRWRTENEVNTSAFIIERSTDGRTFKDVGRAAARPMTISSDYQYSDDVSGLSASKLFYRLREIDNDGSFTYSKTVAVEGSSSVNRFTISPNPAQSYVDLKISGQRVTSTVTVSDFSGRQLLSRSLGTAEVYRLDLSSLPSGTFNITLTNQHGISTQRLVKK